MFIVVKCVYNKPVISHFKYDRLIENVNKPVISHFKYDRLIENVIRILVIVHFTF